MLSFLPGRLPLIVLFEELPRHISGAIIKSASFWNVHCSWVFPSGLPGARLCEPQQYGQSECARNHSKACRILEVAAGRRPALHCSHSHICSQSEQRSRCTHCRLTINATEPIG